MILSCSIGFAQKIPDYSNLGFWYAHPDKKDLTDKCPLLKSEDSIRADVFFVHSTTYINGTKCNGPLHSQSVIRKTNLSLMNQATVFHGIANIYAPAYRQTRLRLYFRNKRNTDSANCIGSLNLAYEDVRTAFLYYMANWNNGQPVILAGHGQGSLHIQRLISEFSSNILKDKLIVAYVPGFRLLHEDELSSIKYCRDSTSTGCAVTWNTYGKWGALDYPTPLYVWRDTGYSIIHHDSFMVTNPFNWRSNISDTIPVNNILALRPSRNRRIPLKTVEYDGRATIRDNALFLYGIDKQIYNGIADFLYRYDYNLFYSLIRANAILRIENFYQAKP